eukprot:gene430-127_t
MVRGKKALAPVQPEDIAELEAAFLAEGTRSTYRSCVNKYLEVCSANGIAETWPCTIQSVRMFSATLKRDGFKSPATYLAAVVRRNKDMGFALDDPFGELKDFGVSCERGLPAQSQVTAASLETIRRMWKAVASELDHDAFVVFVACFVCLSRAEAMLSIDFDRIRDVKGSASGGLSVVEITFSAQKGKLRGNGHTIEFEQLSEPLVLQGKAEFVLCPARVLRLVKARRATASFSYRDYNRALESIFGRAGLSAKNVLNANRAAFCSHSARVGGCCVLLRSGLSESIVRAIANWSEGSSMLQHYSRMVALRPSVVEAWRFYNPIALSGSY